MSEDMGAPLRYGRDELSTSFDEDAEAYERVRPVAPAEVVDELMALARLGPGAVVVEIGPGTGQATRPLAERGLRILALEPGPRLAARTRRNLSAFTDVEVATTTFEAWEPGDARFDAVVACNSFHWLDPAVRFAKAAAVLRPGGYLAVLATPWAVPDGADRFWWDVQDDYVAVGGGYVDPATKHPDRLGDIGPAVRASGLFDEPTIRRRLFAVTMSADDYAANLSTQSGIKELLAPPARADLAARIRRRILDRGGTIEAHLLAVLVVARRGAAGGVSRRGGGRLGGARR